LVDLGIDGNVIAHGGFAFCCTGVSKISYFLALKNRNDASVVAYSCSASYHGSFGFLGPLGRARLFEFLGSAPNERCKCSRRNCSDSWRKPHDRLLLASPLKLTEGWRLGWGQEDAVSGIRGYRSAGWKLRLRKHPLGHLRLVVSPWSWRRMVGKHSPQELGSTAWCRLRQKCHCEYVCSLKTRPVFPRVGRALCP
jgi:hypothetical protein